MTKEDKLSAKMPYVFGSSTPRDFSYLDHHIPAKYRIYNVRMKAQSPRGGEDVTDQPQMTLKDFLREIRRAASPNRGRRDRSADSANARMFVFGSSTPRELSYLERVPHEFRLIDSKFLTPHQIQPLTGDKRSKTDHNFTNYHRSTAASTNVSAVAVSSAKLNGKHLTAVNDASIASKSASAGPKGAKIQYVTRRSSSISSTSNENTVSTPPKVTFNTPPDLEPKRRQNGTSGRASRTRTARTRSVPATVRTPPSIIPAETERMSRDISKKTKEISAKLSNKIERKKTPVPHVSDKKPLKPTQHLKVEEGSGAAQSSPEPMLKTDDDELIFSSPEPPKLFIEDVAVVQHMVHDQLKEMREDIVIPSHQVYEKEEHFQPDHIEDNGVDVDYTINQEINEVRIHEYQSNDTRASPSFDQKEHDHTEHPDLKSSSFDDQVSRGDLYEAKDVSIGILSITDDGTFEQPAQILHQEETHHEKIKDQLVEDHDLLPTDMGVNQPDYIRQLSNGHSSPVIEDRHIPYVEIEEREKVADFAEQEKSDFISHSSAPGVDHKDEQILDSTMGYHPDSFELRPAHFDPNEKALTSFDHREHDLQQVKSPTLEHFHGAHNGEKQEHRLEDQPESPVDIESQASVTHNLVDWPNNDKQSFNKNYDTFVESIAHHVVEDSIEEANIQVSHEIVDKFDRLGSPIEKFHNDFEEKVEKEQTDVLSEAPIHHDSHFLADTHFPSQKDVVHISEVDLDKIENPIEQVERKNLIHEATVKIDDFFTPKVEDDKDSGAVIVEQMFIEPGGLGFEHDSEHSNLPPLDQERFDSKIYDDENSDSTDQSGLVIEHEQDIKLDVPAIEKDYFSAETVELDKKIEATSVLHSIPSNKDYDYPENSNVAVQLEHMIKQGSESSDSEINNDLDDFMKSSSSDSAHELKINEKFIDQMNFPVELLEKDADGVFEEIPSELPAYPTDQNLDEPQFIQRAAADQSVDDTLADRPIFSQEYLMEKAEYEIEKENEDDVHSRLMENILRPTFDSSAKSEPSEIYLHGETHGVPSDEASFASQPLSVGKPGLLESIEIDQPNLELDVKEHHNSSELETNATNLSFSDMLSEERVFRTKDQIVEHETAEPPTFVHAATKNTTESQSWVNESQKFDKYHEQSPTPEEERVQKPLHIDSGEFFHSKHTVSHSEAVVEREDMPIGSKENIFDKQFQYGEDFFAPNVTHTFESPKSDAEIEKVDDFDVRSSSSHESLVKESAMELVQHEQKQIDDYQDDFCEASSSSSEELSIKRNQVDRETPSIVILEPHNEVTPVPNLHLEEIRPIPDVVLSPREHSGGEESIRSIAEATFSPRDDSSETSSTHVHNFTSYSFDKGFETDDERGSTIRMLGQQLLLEKSGLNETEWSPDDALPSSSSRIDTDESEIESFYQNIEPSSRDSPVQTKKQVSNESFADVDEIRLNIADEAFKSHFRDETDVFQKESAVNGKLHQFPAINTSEFSSDEDFVQNASSMDRFFPGILKREISQLDHNYDNAAFNSKKENDSAGSSSPIQFTKMDLEDSTPSSPIESANVLKEKYEIPENRAFSSQKMFHFHSSDDDDGDRNGNKPETSLQFEKIVITSTTTTDEELPEVIFKKSKENIQRDFAQSHFEPNNGDDDGNFSPKMSHEQSSRV